MNERKTSIKALARRLQAIAALGVLALASLLPSASRADTVDWAGITVTYSGAVSLPEAWAARYLVVGGGGAGGTVKNNDANKGQGGGGGAGGFLTGDTTLAAQTYSIFVGAGGTRAADQSAAVAGGDGGSSSITITSTSTAVFTALGGGGGGAQCAGHSGGSGGGGSCVSNAETYPGGSGTSGQGCNGGAGNNVRQAAGGGGAGAVGGNTSSGSGGAGLPSDITGETKYYAGGGGGGRSQGTPAHAGGQGGGGYGGIGTNDGSTPAAGEAATGGGGGGGGRYSTGAAGGSGIVVIRLLMPAIAPTAKADQYFTGAELNGVDDPGSNWVLDHGDMVATNADTYTFWVKPAGTLKWKDSGGTELRQFTWKILPATVPEDQEPQAASLVYNGEEQCGVTPSSSSFYTLIDARQTAAGNYTATARLNNPSGYSNCTWHDGTTGDRSINFTIDQLTVKRPTAKTGLAYTGNPQNGINDSEHAKFYVLGGVTNAVNTGSYVATAAIGDAHQGSCVWETKPGDTTPVNDTIEIPWSIGGYVVAKPTAVTGLVYDGANKVGITPSVDASRYTIVGNTATNAGSYTAQATLNDPANCQWAGEALGVATIDISWSIARQPVPQISIPADSFVYDTNSHFVDVGPAGWSDYSRITVGVTNAFTVGEYSFTVALNDSNRAGSTPAPTSPSSGCSTPPTTPGSAAAPRTSASTGPSPRRRTRSPSSSCRAGRPRRFRSSTASPPKPTGRATASRRSTTPPPRPARGPRTSPPTSASITSAPPSPKPPTGRLPSAPPSSPSGATPTASSATTSTCASRATAAPSRLPTSRSSCASAKAASAASTTAAPASPARTWCSWTPPPTPSCPTRSTPGTSTAIRIRSSGCV